MLIPMDKSIEPLQIILTMVIIGVGGRYASSETTYLERKPEEGIGSLDKESTKALSTAQSLGHLACERRQSHLSSS